MAALPALLTFTILAFAQLARAFDPSPLQDFCVADNNSTLFINGKVCKDPSLATTADFVFSGLDIPGNTTNRFGFIATLVSPSNLPGLNTLGMAIARIDYAPFGLNPPHTHPRATEILTVIEGTLFTGFVSSDNRFFGKVLHRGDVIVYPLGMIHFQQNVGNVPAVALATFNSQNPGVISIANAVFGSSPRIPVSVLKKAFQVGGQVIEKLMAQFN